jgi:hypothetical protein
MDDMEYAWRWFEYHAGQRMTAFHFYLIILGVFLVGFAKALENSKGGTSAALAFAIAFFSLAFLMLEFRNERLVNVGRDALREAEKSFPEGFRLVEKDSKVCCCIAKHGIWFKLIYGAFFIGFMLLGFNPTWLGV